MTLRGLIKRFQPLKLKVSGQLPGCPWSVVLGALNPRLTGVHPPEMNIEMVAEEGAFKKMRFNGIHENWFPAATVINLELWNEYLAVFWEHPANAHNYLSHGTALKAGDVVVDCGCCEGFFVHQALAHKASKIICIEPNPALITCLEKTFANEISTGTVVIKSAALGAFRGRAAFGFDAAYPAFGQLGEVANSEMAKVETLAAVCEELGLTRVDFVKMDIEGAELQAIEGAMPVLKKHHPKLAVTTYHRSFDFVCLKAILGAAGYRTIKPVGITEFGQQGQHRPVMLHAL